MHGGSCRPSDATSSENVTTLAGDIRGSSRLKLSPELQSVIILGTIEGRRTHGLNFKRTFAGAAGACDGVYDDAGAYADQPASPPELQ